METLQQSLSFLLGVLRVLELVNPPIDPIRGEFRI
jgi:hypothetical protein